MCVCVCVCVSSLLVQEYATRCIHATMQVCVHIQAHKGVHIHVLCVSKTLCYQDTTTVTEWAWQEKFIAKIMAKTKRKASLYTVERYKG